MARQALACFLCLFTVLENSTAKSEKISSETNIHDLPYWIQDSLFEYADEIGDRKLTGPIRKIYRKDLNPNYVAYYEFEFEDWSITFSAGPKTGDHRLVEEGQVPRTTDMLIDHAANMNKICDKFFRLNADGTTICEDDAGEAVASTMDLKTLTRHVNITTLPQDIGESLKDFKEEWGNLAKEIRFSNEWKEMSINSSNTPPPVHQRKTIYKVLTFGESQNIPIGTSDVSKVEIKAHLQKTSSHSQKMLSTLCLLIGNICSERGEVNVSSILRKKNNLDNLNYIKIDVTNDYESLKRQLKTRNIDFYIKLIVAGKFVVIRRYTIILSHKRDKRSSWSGFREYSIPYEYLMPDYDQHQCCGGCQSGCSPVAWAQIFAYYDRVAHTYGYRYSTSHWRGKYGNSGYASYKAPRYLNWQAKKYVESLRVPLGTYCRGEIGSTPVKNYVNVDEWFRQRQGSGKVISLSLSNIKQQVSNYVKQNYPVLNSIWYYSSDGSKAGHGVVVTKVKERKRQYKRCRTVGLWMNIRTKCGWNTEYDYEWYRRMGWGGSQNKWYPASAKGAYVAVV